MDADNIEVNVTSLIINHVENFSDEIAIFYNNEDLSDVLLVVEDDEIPAHKYFLAAQSPVFKAMFFGEGNMRERSERKVELHETPLEAFKILLKYIYSGKMTLQINKLDELLDVLALADRYALVNLTRKICEFLKPLIDSNNVLDIYIAASLIVTMFELKQAALAFIDENASVVIKSESFQKLSYNALIEIIKRDSFAAKEIEIFNAVVNWVNANRIEENKNSELFKNIRLSIIDIDDLLGVIRSSEIFTLETIVDAITEQRKNSHENKKRRIFVTNNVATIEKGAKVIEGFAAINDPDRNDPTAVLFNGDLTAIGDKNFVYHNTNGALTIQLDQVYLLSSMRFLLWNGNDRIYKSYGIEVSTDHDSWNKLCENNDCKSWQIIRFDQQAVRYIRITGTGNTDNEGFHIIHFECPSTV